MASLGPLVSSEHFLGAPEPEHFTEWTEGPGQRQEGPGPVTPLPSTHTHTPGSERVVLGDDRF